MEIFNAWLDVDGKDQLQIKLFKENLFSAKKANNEYLVRSLKLRKSE